MSTAKPATMTLAFHDQSIGLIIFGVFQILLGCTVGLRALLLAVYAAKGPLFHPGVEAMRTEMLVPGAVTFYLLPAVIFIWLGIGSIRARRWACTLTVILSWLWLIMGLFMTILQVVFAPLIFEWIGRYHGKISYHDIGLLQVRETANMAGIYVLLPIAFLLFYQRMAVRATCHWRDLRGSWTDRCPMPVLAMSILLATSVLWMSWWVVYCCLMAFFPYVQLPDWYALLTTFHLVMSFGGTIPIALGTLLFLLIMVLSVYLAWGIYRRRMDAWWGTLCFCAASTAAAVWAFTHSELMKLYETMCLPPFKQERSAGWNSFFEPTPATFTWLAIFAGAMTICYLLYVHRYFVGSDEVEIVFSPCQQEE